MCQEIGCFTSEIEKNTSEIDFFLGGIVVFLGQVVAIIADVEPRKVKRYLFSQEADLTFRNTLQLLKCSDLQQTAFGGCYITKRTRKVGIPRHEGGLHER